MKVEAYQFKVEEGEQVYLVTMGQGCSCGADGTCAHMTAVSDQLQSHFINVQDQIDSLQAALNVFWQTAQKGGLL